MQSDNRAGLIFALAGFALLSVGDVVAKSMEGQWSPIAVAALRFIFGAIGLSGLLASRQGASGFRPRRPWLQVARGACLAGATLCFFTAIFIMPLAAATALVFVSPIITAILSGPILKEPVRPVTWIASVFAFGGVLLILRPNFYELGIAALLPLGSALCLSLLFTANRAAAKDGTPLSMQALMACVTAPLLVLAAFAGRASGIEVLQFGWPDWTVVARCAVVAVTASGAHWLIYLGTTRAGAALVAPMTYVQLLVVVTFGWLLFGEVPDLATIGGAAIIIGAGLCLWWSGRVSSSAISN